MTGRPLSDRAERALLGALLISPGLAPDLSFVHPEHFRLREHMQIFTAITRLRASGIAGPDYAAQLAQACPDDTHARYYGELVVEAAVLRARFSQARPAIERRPPCRLVQGDDVHGAGEEHVLAAIIQQYDEATPIPGWLTADAFTTSACRALYQAIRRLWLRGEPVDELTVDWENARHAHAPLDEPGYRHAARLARMRVSVPDAVCYAALLAHRYQNKPGIRHTHLQAA